jgi:hypothetical protein
LAYQTDKHQCWEAGKGRGYEEAMGRGFQLYQELRVAERDLARFRSLYESFSKYAASLAARADALDAERLAAEKKELGGRLFELA